MTQHPSEGSSATADDERFQRVSDQLKVAFQQLADPAVPADQRPDLHRRLIAITNSAKHDLATAETRLDRYWADWETTVGPRST